jgi:choline dehydrogenase
MAEMLPESADYIVVGAGSAGCVVAARLSEDPGVRVVLLEAGGKDSNPWIHLPVGYAKTMYHPTLSWNFMTEPEPNLDNRKLIWPRGRVLGGSSSLNGLIYIRGQKEDYDHWRQLGCTGWSFDDVLPYFKLSEDNERGADALHGKGGPLAVSDLRHKDPLVKIFIEAAVQAGIPHNPDFNGPVQEGVGSPQTTTRNGLRWSTARAYLKPARSRPNLAVITHAQSTGIVVENGRAAGVKLRHHGAEFTVKARREVILCGGAIASPHLLLLSGIGPAEHLREHGIAVMRDMPGVGRNLQDHLQTRMVYRLNRPMGLNGRKNSIFGLMGMGLEYAFTRSGPLTWSAGVANVFARVLPGSASPDVQFHMLPFSSDKPGPDLHRFPGMTVSTCQLRPESRGTITLASADPMQKALIHANYLATETDRRCMIEGLRLIRRVMAQPAIASLVVDEYLPGEKAESDEALLAHIRATSTTIFHPSGTCRMGGDAESVVDPELRVRGIDGLRVADAAIMPTVVSGNTNAACIMIGEKCADMVKASAKQKLAA